MAATAQSAVWGTQGRILIASGNSEFRRQMAAHAENRAAETEEAVGGAHALAKLLQVPCDGVLLDQNLPDLDAEEVANIIRQKYPRIEVKFVDSKTESAAATEAERKRDEVPEAVAATLDDLGDEKNLHGMIGTSQQIQKIYQLSSTSCR